MAVLGRPCIPCKAVRFTFTWLGDFNRDQKLDLAVAYSNYGSNESAFVRILLGNGDGTFRKGARALAAPIRSRSHRQISMAMERRIFRS